MWYEAITRMSSSVETLKSKLLISFVMLRRVSFVYWWLKYSFLFSLSSSLSHSFLCSLHRGSIFQHRIQRKIDLTTKRIYKAVMRNFHSMFDHKRNKQNAKNMHGEYCIRLSGFFCQLERPYHNHIHAYAILSDIKQIFTSITISHAI